MKFRVYVFLWCALVFAVRAVNGDKGPMPEKDLIQKLIAQADELWLGGAPEEAVAKYAELLNSPSLIEEYRSLVLMRLARGQLAAGRPDKCREVLGQLKSLKYLPEHHRAGAAEIENELGGKCGSALTRTAIPLSHKVAARVYVSGRANAKGADGSRKHPYVSLEDARQRVRILREKGNLGEGAIEILLLGDFYLLEKPFRLAAQDSGTKRNPLVLRSCSANSRVSLSGGRILSKWSREKDTVVLGQLPESSRSRVLVADLVANNVPKFSELVFGGFSSQRAVGGSYRFASFAIPELFYEGRPQTMARWPNEGDTSISLSDFKDDRPLRWVAEKDLWLHGYWYHMWADAYEKVESVSKEKRTIKLEPPFNRHGFDSKKYHWHAVNALSELDVPGEWHLSVAEGKIRFLAPEDFKPNNSVLSVYGPIIEVTDCNYVTVRDLDICYARGDAVIFSDCSDVTLSDISVKYSSGFGLRIKGGFRHLVHSCTIESMGRGGIDTEAGQRKSLTGSGSIIENCRISDLSRIDRTYTPALLLVGVGTRVRRCLFLDIPSSAIRLEGNDMLIELNEFARCVSESDDQGAIDMWGNPTYRGNIIRWNYFHDIVTPNGMSAGVRLDDAISGVMISENVFIKSSNGIFGGIQIHGGKDNHIEGNIFVQCHIGMSNSPWGDDRWKQRLSSHYVFVGALKSVPWQSGLWHSRYPALKHLVNGPADRNFYADNIFINGEMLYARKSDNSPVLNDQSRTIKPAPSGLKELESVIVPWHRIPLRDIGLY